MCEPQGPFDNISIKIKASWKNIRENLNKTGAQAIEKTIQDIKPSYEQLGALRRQNEAVLKMQADLDRMVHEAEEQCKGPIRQLLLNCG